MKAFEVESIVCRCGYEAPPFDWNEWVRDGKLLICPVCSFHVMTIEKEVREGFE